MKNNDSLSKYAQCAPSNRHKKAIEAYATMQDAEYDRTFVVIDGENVLVVQQNGKLDVYV